MYPIFNSNTFLFSCSSQIKHCSSTLLHQLTINLLRHQLSPRSAVSCDINNVSHETCPLCRCNLGHSGAGALQLLYSIMGAAGVLPGWATRFVYQ